MANTWDIALVGADAAVGEAILEILEERRFPVGELYPLAVADSAGGRVTFQGREVTVEDVAGFDFGRARIAFFCAGAEVSAQYALDAAAAGCIVIDHHSRGSAAAPVVPEVNPHAVGSGSGRIVANPGSAAIPLAVVLKPLYDAVGIERIDVATYQAVSDSGKGGIDELAEQTRALFNQKSFEPGIYPERIAFNVLPQIGELLDDGHTREETELAREIQQILEDDAIGVNATMVWVPVFYGHSLAVHIETGSEIRAAEAAALLEKAPGVEIFDARGPAGYPTPALDAVGQDTILVGRIREDPSRPRGLNLWIVVDNLRKGAALNSVQIAELAIENSFS